MNISYSAPVGIILSGESGLLYGKPAFGSALNVFVKAHISEGTSKSVSRFYSLVVQEVEKVSKKKLDKDFHKKISVSFPDGIPLDFEGIEAAEIVAVTALVCDLLFNKSTSQEEINKIAFHVHKNIRRHVSGMYTSLSSFGGIIYYRKEFEFLKGIYKLSYKIPKDIEKDLRINFSYPADPYIDQPKNAEKILSDQEKMTKRAIVAIIKEDAKLFFDQFPPDEKKDYPFSQSFDGVVKE